MPAWFQTATLVVLGLILLADLLVVAKRPHIPSLRECAFWVSGYVLLALLFAGLLLAVAGGESAGEFVAGWVTEYSLSVDNLFVFVIIMSRFSVPRGHQQTVLMMGIILSLVLRGLCIVVGAAVIERFSWVFYLFGAFLVYTAVQLARGHGDADDYEENVAVRLARRVLPVAPEYHGSRLTVRSGGRRMVTPMVVVLLAIGSTDLLFALDSIPAIFGLTEDPFVVFTATLFALMGLRQLYFLLGGLLDRLVYLSTGLAVVLGFIGVKLVLNALHLNEVPFVNGGRPVGWAPEIPISVSLLVIVAVLAITTVASLVSTRREERAAAQATGPHGGPLPDAEDADDADDAVDPSRPAPPEQVGRRDGSRPPARPRPAPAGPAAGGPSARRPGGGGHPGPGLRPAPRTHRRD